MFSLSTDFIPLKLGAISDITRLSKLNGVPLGLHIIEGNKKNAEKAFKKGVNFIAYLTDTVLLQNY